MSEEKEESAGSAAAASAPAGGGSKIVMIASVANAAATVAVIALLFLSHQKEKSKPGVEDIVAGEKAAGHGGGGGGEHGAKKEEGGHGGGGEHGGGGHGAEPVIADAGKMIPLDPFTVNLSSGSVTSPRYVRMNIAIELEQGVSDQEFTVKLPRVRDTVINLLNSKKASEVSAPDGRDMLKDEIKKSVNSFMLQSKVKGVYFTNFAVSQ